MANRIDKDNYYLNIAEEVSKRSTCLQKHWGAVIVKNDTIISTGFNGAPRKIDDCMKLGFCNLQNERKKVGKGRGTMYEYCLSVHAEQNALLFADKDKLDGATLYLVGFERRDLEGNWYYVSNPNPCHVCRKMIVNAQIENLVVRIDSEHNKYVNPQREYSRNEIVGNY